MIPMRLQLHNFLCYRNPEPLDFRGIQLACLTGENGAGKSSLLDAMTWALWGQARTPRDNDLIYQNEEEMQVQFDFSLAGSLYRAIRKRSSRGRGRSVLDLQIQDTNSFRSLAEPTIRATQEKIDRLLRLDYRTFINSAFLLQGRANEFTVQTPGERKAILAKILGLDVWEIYEDRTKKQSHEIEQRAIAVAAQIAEIDRELDRQEEFNDTLMAAEERALQLTGELHAAENAVREIEAARQARELKRGRQNDLAERIDQASRHMKRITADLVQQHDLVDECNAVLAQRDEIEGGHAALVEAREEECDLGLKLSEHGPLAQRRAELEGAIEAARADLLARQRSLTERCAELEQAAQGDGLITQLLAVNIRLAELQDTEVARDAAREQLTALATEAASLSARNDALRAEMETAKAKIAMLSVDGDADCPLCLQPLTKEHQQKLVTQFQTAGTVRGNTWRENEKRVTAISGEREAIEDDLRQLESSLAGGASLQRQAATLTQKLDATAEAGQRLEKLQLGLELMTLQLEDQKYASEERVDLAAVQAEIAALDYDQAAHLAARATIGQFHAFEARHADLGAAAEKTRTAEGAINDLDSQAAEWGESLAADSLAHGILRKEITELTFDLMDAEIKERELSLVRESKVVADNEVGGARQRLAGLESQRKRQEQLLTEQSELAKEAAIYQELRAAFGKRGVPAMIIEAIIPEIEETANRLLAKMTDGRMHLRFETQREKVTGGLAETLDIIISDELGSRNYELYSGGESFRVNFAIRIALSKLLAGRAGAQLRTLFIDEGFGTQDSRGRERLVEAINAIQSDFDRVLVITHIDELKDAFPVRIEVTKNLRGSEICVT